MPWKNLKIFTIIKKRLLHRKMSRSTKLTSAHYFKKIAFVGIIVLSVIVLSTVTVDFSLNKSVVQANTMQGIGVGIYWNQECTNRTLSLNWGSTVAGSGSNLTIYVRNEGNSVVSLRLSASEWIPSTAQSCMSLNWNYTNQVLSAGGVIPIELTLSVSPTICDINNFSFDVTVTTIGA
jgi:hypothetical protein